MGEFFDQDDVFPIIARIIDDYSSTRGDYMTHDSIVNCLSEHPEGSAFVERAMNRARFDKAPSQEWSRDRWASIMIEWFSQRITVADSPWRHRFERTKIGSDWAYKSKPDA